MDKKKYRNGVFILLIKTFYPKKLLNRSLGHKAGIDTAIQICKETAKNKLTKNLTFYTFSTENWKRSPTEVSQLFKLINDT